MSATSLAQDEADALLAVGKQRSDSVERDYPGLGGNLSAPLVSVDGREHFFLDIRRGRLNLRKRTYQNRGRQVIVLARLDFEGPPHRNPDGEEIGSTHLHLYREGYGDKWAYPVPPEQFPNQDDPWLMLDDFMRYCRIVEPPRIRRGLFV